MHHKVIMVTQAPKQLVNDMQMDYAESVDEAIRMSDELEMRDVPNPHK